jgi:hypothetical protein
MNVYVPSLVVDEIPAIDLDSRGGGEEQHEEKQGGTARGEKLCAVLYCCHVTSWLQITSMPPLV